MPIELFHSNQLDNGNIKKKDLLSNGKSFVLKIPNLRRLPNNFPDDLYSLDLSGSSQITELGNIPPVTILNLTGTGIAELPDDLSGNVIILDLTNTRITKLPAKLPKNLKVLILKNTNIKNLHNLPPNLTELNLEGCNELSNLADEDLTRLIIYLEELVSRGCKVIYPDNFPKDKITKLAEEKLENLEVSYQFSSKAIELFRRYINDEAHARGGSSQFALNVVMIFKVIEKNPKHLKWIEEVADGYLEGCVNQPLVGFFVIATWLLMDEKNKLEKIEALNPLIAVNVIICFLIEQKKVSVGYDAELANALLREVCKKLLNNQDIFFKWFGVPEKIVNEKRIAEFLTEKTIDDVYQIVKIFLQKSPSEKMEDIFKDSRNINIWGVIVFFDYVNVIKTKYEQVRNPLGELFLLIDSPEKKLAEIKIEIGKLRSELNKINYAISDDARKVLESVTFGTKSLKKVLEEMSDSLSNNEQSEISAKVVTLTKNFIVKCQTPSTITMNPRSKSFVMTEQIAQEKSYRRFSV